MALEESLQTQLQELIAAATGSTGDDYDMNNVEADALFHLIIKNDTAQVVPVTHREHRQKWAWWAAAIFVLVSIGCYFIFFNNKEAVPEIVRVPPTKKDVKAPETNRAMITLADGTTVYLDSVYNGQLAMQGHVQLVKLANGQIAYHLSAAQAGTASGEILKELQYNTLTNPRGSKIIDMQLSDGSHVWLNAGSSVTYPVAFVGDERNVQVTGEAYFEIVPDSDTSTGKKRSFIVQKNDLQIQVLGTKFNVNSYDNEPDIKVTLLEGLVKVSNSTNSMQIQPGQQAAIHHSRPTGSSGRASFIIHHSVDTEQVIAWKNGIQSFDNADIQTIMRQVERWYNVDVSYRGTVPKRVFTGDIPATISLSELLKLLEVNKINFEIDAEKKQLVVIP